MRYKIVAAVAAAGTCLALAAPAAQAAPQHAKRPAVPPAITYVGWPWMTIKDLPVPYEPEIQVHFKVHEHRNPNPLHVTMWIERWAPEGGPYVYKKFTFGSAQMPEPGHTKELTFSVLCRPGTYYTKWLWTSPGHQEPSTWYWPRRSTKIGEPQNSIHPPDRHESRSVKSC